MARTDYQRDGVGTAKKGKPTSWVADQIFRTPQNGPNFDNPLSVVIVACLRGQVPCASISLNIVDAESTVGWVRVVVESRLHDSWEHQHFSKQRYLRHVRIYGEHEKIVGFRNRATLLVQDSGVRFPCLD